MGHGLYVCGIAMKPKSLYVKILLAFIGVLFVTMILIVILFIGTAGRSFKRNIDK